MNREYRIGILEIGIAALVMSFSGPLIRWAGISAGAMTFVRCAIPTLILGTWLLLHRQIEWLGKKTLWLLLASTLNAVRMWLFFESYRITSMGNAVIVLYSWPVFALIYSYFLLGESLKKRDFILMGLAFVGMAIVYSGGNLSFSNRDFLGMSLMLASALMYALMIVLIRRENVERLQATFWQNLVGSLAYFPVFIRALSSTPPESWFLAGLNGLIVGTGAFALFFSALRRLPAAVVGHVAYLEVVFTLIWGMMIFREPVSWRHITGGCLIVISMMIRAELARRNQSRPELAKSTV